MWTDFSCVGFPLKSPNDLTRIADKVYPGARSILCSHGRCAVWSSDNGIEVWLHLNEEDKLYAIWPHFHGSCLIQATVTEVLRDSDDPLGGRVSCATLPGPRPYGGERPFQLLLPDFGAVYPSLTPGNAVKVQLSAFAHELSCYRNIADFDKQQEREQARTGSLGVAHDAYMFLGGKPQAYFGAQVLKAELLKNPITRRKFHHIQAQMRLGMIDIVADPNFVHGTPVVGGIVKAVCEMRGRISVE